MTFSSMGFEGKNSYRDEPVQVRVSKLARLGCRRIPPGLNTACKYRQATKRTETCPGSLKQLLNN